MAQPAQVKFGTLAPTSFVVIDNGAAGASSGFAVAGTVTASTSTWTGIQYDGSCQGFDTIAIGAVAQATNPFGDTGSTTLDTVNDTVYADPSVSTVKGNPVQNAQPSYATVTTVLNSPLSTRILFKNPA